VRYPLTGYVGAVVLATLAVVVTSRLIVLDPGFRFTGFLIAIVVVVVALTFGTGPSMLAAVVGVGLLWILVLPPPGAALRVDVGDAAALVLLVAMATVMGILTSRREQARRDAEEATRVRDTFLSLASHELRNPLTTIKLSAQLAQRRVHRLASAHNTEREHATEFAPGLAPELEKLSNLLTGLETAVDHQDRLVDELLDVSRIQTGQLTFHMAPCDLTRVAQQATEEQRQQRPDREIRLHAPTQSVTVLADAQRIGQVITNYLTNALKYSPSDQPVDVRLTVAASAATVSVRDRGPGLAADEQADVWELYHRAPGIEVVSGRGIGLGLGLYLCRSILLAHRGGEVGVDSEKGVGSTFWFTLPLLPGVLATAACAVRS
jgi:signal transduction histidine kinase